MFRNVLLIVIKPTAINRVALQKFYKIIPQITYEYHIYHITNVQQYPLHMYIMFF